MRLLHLDIDLDGLGDRLNLLMDALDCRSPRGLGPGGVWSVRGEDALRSVLIDGAQAAVTAGFGIQADLVRCEDLGRLPDADPVVVSDRALHRGLRQLGSLGSGNHFLEVKPSTRSPVPTPLASSGSPAAGSA